MSNTKKTNEEVSKTENYTKTITKTKFTSVHRAGTTQTVSKNDISVHANSFGPSTSRAISNFPSSWSESWKYNASPTRLANASLRENFLKSPIYKNDASMISAKPTLFTVNWNTQTKTESPASARRTLPSLGQPLTTSTPLRSVTGVVENVTELQSKMKIKVTKSVKFYDDDRKIPTYKTSSKNRGNVLLINNMFEGEKNHRAGAEVDESNLKELFKQMGFKIEKHRNKKKNDMESIIRKYGNDKTHKNSDISVVIIMSHGSGGVGSNSTVIQTADNFSISISWIVEQFDRDNCKYLIGKPKIFIFQCCRGEQDQSIQTDASPFHGARKEADVLLAYSTIPGYLSYRNPKLGSIYIQAICDVFMNHAHDTDVESLLKIVDQRLENHNSKDTLQTSSYENRGFKRCYLHPK